MPNDQVSMERLQLLADIASWYYLDGLSQQDIADRVGMSRPSISRLLLDARELGIVEISINHPIPTLHSLEVEMESRYSLREVRVPERKTASDDETLRLLGRLGATVLNNILQDGMILGLSWGSSVHAFVEALRPRRLPRVKVVQLIGGVGAPYRTIDAPEQCRRAADMFGAQHFYLNAPLYVDNPDVAIALREDHSIKEVLELARQADVVLMGVGPIVPEICTPFHAGYLSYEDLRKLDRLGVVGIISTSNFNIHGEYVPAPWIEECAIGITFEDMHRFGTVIILSTDRRKAPAILGAVRTGIVDILITDDVTAEAVLELDDRLSAEEGHQRRSARTTG